MSNDHDESSEDACVVGRDWCDGVWGERLPCVDCWLEYGSASWALRTLDD